MEELLSGKYDGRLVDGRMDSSEATTYQFATGTVYEGPLRNGAFHGQGVLVFPGKGRFAGTWDRGTFVTGSFTFEDGLAYDRRVSGGTTKEFKQREDSDAEAEPEEKQGDAWLYCTAKDRRYWHEQQEGLRPAGQELVRSNAGKVPAGCLDAVDSYMDPKTGCTHDFDGKVIRMENTEDADLKRQRAFIQPI